MEKLKYFRFWCQKVLPLVYDDSLSYYELLCKVVAYLNNMIKDTNAIIDEVEELEKELKVIQEWIDNFSTDYLEKIVEESLLKMIIVGLTNDGHIVFYIVQSWDDITFNTSGYDISIPDLDFGHLVLSY